MRELVGPVMDMYDARRRGVSATRVMSRGFVEVARMPLRVRLAFFVTNAPLFVASAWLLWSPHVGCSSTARLALCVSTTAVALASTLFHGCVLFGMSLQLVAPDGFEQTAVRFLQLDVLSAYVCGLTLCASCGAARTAAYIGIPAALLSLSNHAKWRGHSTLYALLHGSWHVLAAVAICLISHTRPD